MKMKIISLLVISMFAGVGQATLTVLENFNDLNLGSIDMQHVVNEYGEDIELWNAQQNSDRRGDSLWSKVVEEGPDASKCLKPTNRDRNEELDTVYTCLYLTEELSIFAKGTIYMQFKADGLNDCITGGNDLFPGYSSDVYGDPTAGNDLYQDTVNHPAQGPILANGWRRTVLGLYQQRNRRRIQEHKHGPAGRPVAGDPGSD